MSDTAKSELPLFYSAVEALDKERHATLGFAKKQRDYRFAADTSAVRLTIGEFNLALKNYPIVFNSTTEPQPVAVLGLRRDQNLFVKPDGTWLEGAYIPTYVRRYPFIFGATGEENRYALCVDTATDQVSNTPEVPFFENGELSEAGKAGLELCHTFQEQNDATIAMMARLSETNLLTRKDATARMADGQDQLLGTYVAVDEEKLSQLSDEEFLDLRHKGLLPVIYLHLTSLSNWMRLLEMHVARAAGEQAASAPPANETSAPSGA